MNRISPKRARLLQEKLGYVPNRPLNESEKIKLGLKVKIKEPKALKKSTQRNTFSDNWLNKPDVIVFEDGRERCNPRTPGGKAEYKLRKFLMWLRQYDKKHDCPVCCICREPLEFDEATFEHEAGRLHIDERIEDSDGRPLNGVSHGFCNTDRGSRKTTIWKGGGQMHIEADMMTAEQCAYILGRICYCGRPKGVAVTVCPNCLIKLSPQLRLDLFTLTGKQFSIALADAQKLLRN